MGFNGIKLGLERIQKLLFLLGNPQYQIPIIHIAGTNGKGSISKNLFEILIKSNFKVGKFTSPYLFHPKDSINLNQNFLNLKEFQEINLNIKNLSNSNKINATSFEILTAIAFKLFSDKKFNLDLAIIEVGLGGLNDSTNVCKTENTLFNCITPISFDHENFLGQSIKAITLQKAGIFKNLVPILISQQNFNQVNEIIKIEAAKKNCDLFLTKPYNLPKDLNQKFDPLPLNPIIINSNFNQLNLFKDDNKDKDKDNNNNNNGNDTIPNPINLPALFLHQNLTTSITLANLLRKHSHSIKILPKLKNQITNQTILNGIKNFEWQGRLDFKTFKLNEILLDGAHNSLGALALNNFLIKFKRPIIFIISLSQPRNFKEFFDSLNLNSLIYSPKVIITKFSDRNNNKDLHLDQDDYMNLVKPINPNLLSNYCNKFILNNSIFYCPTILDSLEKSLLLKKDQDKNSNVETLIVVTGSLYLVSDALKILKENP